MINTVRGFALTIVCLTWLASLAFAQVVGGRGGAQFGQRMGGQRGSAQAPNQSQDAPPLKDKIAARNGGGAAKPSGKNLSAQQQKNLQKLQTDLNSIKQG